MADDTKRVQRWRASKREQGLKAVTVWFTPERELRLKDLALQWHCSPSEVLQRAFDQLPTIIEPHIGSPTDTELIRELIRAELAPLQAELTANTSGNFPEVFQAELAAIQAALTEVQGELATVTATVTETVTATLTRDLPGLVRQHVEGLALEALGMSVTDTYSNATDAEENVTDTYSSVAETEEDDTDTHGNVADAEEDVTDTFSNVTETSTRKPVTEASNGNVTETPAQGTARLASKVEYDSTRHVLGPLCPRGHDFHGTGQSLRRLKDGKCLACAAEQTQERRKTKRQAK